MTREEAIYRLKNTAWLGSDDDREEAEEAVTMAIKALEDIERWRTWSHTYDNIISRQDAIDCVGWGDSVTKVIDRIKSLPSAEPKTGKCKDCTHWDKLDYEAPRQGWCYQFEEFTDADEYCSRCAMMRGESHEVCVYR